MVRASETPPRICAAIREARLEAGYPQVLAASEVGVSQPEWSRWETFREPSLDQISAIEQVLHLPRGHLLRRAGYVAEARRTEDVIASDTRLTPFDASVVLDALKAAVRRSRREA